MTDRKPRTAIDVDNVQRRKIKLDSQARNSDEEITSTMLVVCDPVENPKKGTRTPLTKEEAKEVLTALGLIPDPKHTEMNWMGRQRGT